MLTQCRFLAGDNSVSNSLTGNNKVSRLVVWVLLIISLLVLIRLAPTLVKPENLPSDDFFQFWAAGNQNIHGENPFDPQIIEQRRIQEGSIPSGSVIPVMLNPPWAITLLMPFGLTRYPLSRFAWLIFSIVLLLFSAQLLWRIYSGNPKLRWLPILMVFIFAPSISVLEKGQITPIVVLGITGFLYYSSYHQNDWFAGVFLALASVKPQMALIFWLAVFIWVIFKRRWKVLISFFISIMIMIFVALVFNQNMILQYIDMLQTYHITEWATPTIGSYLRLFWLGTENFWLQFLPVVFGVGWLVYIWNQHQKSWNWMDELPIILLVSMVFSPYSWTYDLVLLIPAVVLATIWITEDWKRWSTLLLLVLFLSISVIDLVLHMRLDDFWFIWVAPALLTWFLLVRWQYPKSKSKPELKAV